MAWTTPRTYVSGETLTAAIMNTDVRDNWNAAFPVGSLHWRMQAATTSETTIDGMLLEANAVSVLRATYAALNTKLSGLSYPFGTVDGTHMTLPDLFGRSPVMMSSGGNADVNALGDSDGITKASRTPKASAHSHTETAHTHSTPAHTHGAGSYGVTLPSTATPLNGTPGGVPGSGALSVTGNSASDGASTTGSGGGGTTGSGGGASGAYLVVGVIGCKY